jgi:hypothetical protein
MQALSLTHSVSLSHTHTPSLSLSRAHTHTHTLKHTHTHSLTHTHTLSLSLTHTHTISPHSNSQRERLHFTGKLRGKRPKFRNEINLGEREFKPPWREAGPLNHHDDMVDPDRQNVSK